MAKFINPQIATNGLVMYYDMTNTQKSWKGAPSTNLHPLDGYITWPSQTTHFWNGNNWVVDATYTDPGTPGPAGVYIGKVRKYTSGALSATWSGNSYAYVLKTAPMTSGQSYAMSAYTYMSPDCNIDGLDSSIEGASVAALSGGYITSYDTAKKGSWQRQGLTGTAAGNVNYILAYARKYGVTNGAFTGFFMVGGAMVETGVFPTPYTDGTRSNTQAIVDLTNNNTITASSLTYASDNTFSFNGSNTYITASNTSMVHGTSGFTYSCWVNFASLPGLGTLFENGMYTNGILIRFENNLIHVYSEYASTSYNSTMSFNPTIGLWYNLVLTRIGNTLYLYSNGTQISSTGFGTNINIIPSTSLLYIGMSQHQAGQCFNGKIANASVYNRALSAAEVAQNFNALRGRYSL